MSARPPLMVPDLEALRAKLSDPPAGLDHLLARFRERLRADAEFRAPNLYLEALLGEADALEQARAQVLAQARDFGSRPDDDNGVDYHTWCVAAPALRTCVFFDWLSRHGVWTEAEAAEIAGLMLHFGYQHCVNVLLSRYPVANNQSLSMALYCAVCGYLFRDLPDFFASAERLHRFGMDRLGTTLGPALPDGYWGEGSTYQHGVVAPLVMWSAAFLSALAGPALPTQPWPPGGARLLDPLHVEACLPSPGLLLPAWDHYGWMQWLHVAPLAYYADAVCQPELLSRVPEMWDRHPFAAWGQDDRMWALLYWPNLPVPPAPSSGLSGWSLPRTAAALDDLTRRARLLLAWDRCASDTQGLGRVQVNPNHLLYELEGEPVFADGIAAGEAAFLSASSEEIAAPLGPEERALIAAQYGGGAGARVHYGRDAEEEPGVERWARQIQVGLLGAANTVVIDGEVGYFPPDARSGQLVCEDRTPERHLVTAESLAYFLPRYDLSCARRTVALSSSGLCWMVDDYRAASDHAWTWQVYLQPGGELSEGSLGLTTTGGRDLCLAWSPVEGAELIPVPEFPSALAGEGRLWPSSGSERLELRESGQAASFVVCLLPGVREGLKVTCVGDNRWRATWPGGSEEFSLPAESLQEVEILDCPPDHYSDLDFEPFPTREEPDAELLEDLRSPRPEHWRRSVAAMHTLTARGVNEAYPLMQELLRDRGQRYLVHSVAAWCLGHARYAPALEDLRFVAHSPEPNTRLRAQWAVAALERL